MPLPWGEGTLLGRRPGGRLTTSPLLGRQLLCSGLCAGITNLRHAQGLEAPQALQPPSPDRAPSVSKGKPKAFRKKPRPSQEKASVQRSGERAAPKLQRKSGDGKGVGWNARPSEVRRARRGARVISGLLAAGYGGSKSLPRERACTNSARIARLAALWVWPWVPPSAPWPAVWQCHLAADLDAIARWGAGALVTPIDDREFDRGLVRPFSPIGVRHVPEPADAPSVVAPGKALIKGAPGRFATARPFWKAEAKVLNFPVYSWFFSLSPKP